MSKKHFIIGLLLALLAMGYTPSTSAMHQDSTITTRVLFIPNAFSPNGDGLNDVFKIVNLDKEEILYFKIFNKWGTVMYEDKSNGAKWDGYYKGKLQEEGEYGYVITIRYPESDVTQTYKGSIHLLLH